MRIFDAIITLQAYSFLKGIFTSELTFENANKKMFDDFGIVSFFNNIEDFESLEESFFLCNECIVEEQDRIEYGDFQTNKYLASEVVKHLSEKNISPEIIIEPTCGKGNFILASLSSFKSVKKLYGIEIHKPYIWETKFSIIDFFLSYPNNNKPEISIIHSSIFEINFKSISKGLHSEELLIIGNPPWVTNSKLGMINSTNLPRKSNFKKNNGLDSITGKGNFDIAENIVLMIFDSFQFYNGHIALLVKNSVIKNIVFSQKEKKYRISKIEKYYIDSKKEFNVSVEASLMYCKFNSNPSIECDEYDFYDKKKKNKFGWVESKFVSNIEEYFETNNIDGVCPFEWRQGIKHDCSNVMELERNNDCFVNKVSEEVNIEKDLVYGFLKSSDLKNTVIKRTRKYTIVTQNRVGQDTSYIQYLYPMTYAYLKKNISSFLSRKSSIYNGKPMFSIFGIGEYSFKPYKVAISALYKTYHFTLVLPQDDKPIMLDDTCYFIGFDKIEFAVYTIILLNYYKTEAFLKSISFSDAKRVFTKDLLMRLDLLNLSKTINNKEILDQIEYLNAKYNININLSLWRDYIKEMTKFKTSQLTIFPNNEYSTF